MTHLDTPTAHPGELLLGGDLPVRRLGLGAMRLTGSGAFHDGVPSDRATAIAVLRRAVELGVNHIDTAAFYFSRLRSANELINTALAPYADDLVIATKVGPSRDALGEWNDRPTPAELRGQVEENLRQLGRDHLDVVTLRLLSRRHPIAEYVGVLARMREEGLIRHIGLSNAGPEQVAEARTVAPVVAVQNAYALGYRPETDAFIAELAAEGVAFTPFFSIAGKAREAGNTGGDADEVGAIAAKYGVSTAELKIAWSLHKSPNILAIPGTGNPAHLEANVAAGRLRLSGEDLAALEAVHRAGAED